jgi:23S rRNA (uracil1939-C5)-methyltransferase
LHSEHTVQIEKLVVGGDGLGRLQFNDKPVVIFVAQAAPGETVRVRIIGAEKNHLQGEIVEIITASSSRRHPKCEYFLSCGGCTWQHITETEQLLQKEQILSDLFKKFIPGADFKLLESVESENTFNYRNRIQLKQLDNKIGYFKKRSHQIVDITHCPIAERRISDEIPRIKTLLKPASEIRKFELRINHLNEFEHYPIGEDGEGLSFSQVNSNVNGRLVSEVVQLVQALRPTGLTELYAGAGNFTFPLLQALPDLKIESVELNSKLTSFSTMRLTEQRLQKRLFAFTADCESFVERRALSEELVLLDPPRSGCSEQVLQKVIATSPRHLLYVSCHPVFLARDLAKILNSVPSYKIRHVRIFDMFPQTDHFETLILLGKD